MKTIILDGVAAKQRADQWAIVLESEKPVALGVVSANETLNFALAGLFNMSFAEAPRRQVRDIPIQEIRH